MRFLPIGWRLALVAVALTSTGALAQQNAEPVARITDYGQTAGRRLEERSSASDQGLEPPRPMSGVSFIERTTQIEARLCRTFGVKVELNRAYLDDPPGMFVQVLHPKFTAPDGRTSVIDGFPDGFINGVANVGFGFDHEWEMQPGDWTIVVYIDDEEIDRKEFTVTLPPEGASRSDCGVS